MNTEQYLKRKTNFYQTDLWRKMQHPLLIKELLSATGMQRNYTPVELCIEITGKLAEYANLVEAKIAVLFNLEFVDTLIRVYRVDPANITFFADSKVEADAARKWYKVECPNELIVWDSDKKRIIMPNIKKKFDVVVMNPPYQGSTKDGEQGRNNLLWPGFVELAIELAHKDGHIAAVHPNKWRKPADKMFPLMTAQNILHLEMRSKKDGIKTFGAMTPYDWYIMQKAKYRGETTINGMNGKREIIDLRDFSFLPNCDLEQVSKLIAKPGEKKCEVLFSTFYHNQHPHMSHKKESKFIHPCVHGTGKSGVRFMYSSKKEEHFGVPKVIFGDADTIANAVVDFDGEYGMTEHGIAILISSRAEGDAIKKSLESEAFNNLLQNALRWSQFQISYKMFSCFRKDFYKDFI